jgi:predicted O-methyltransferase YrrM
MGSFASERARGGDFALVERASTEASADPLETSLANLSDLLLPCLDAAGAKTVIEIGAYRGELTRELLAWASGSGARVTAIDPEPAAELNELSEWEPGVELVAETSLEALPRLPPGDAVIVDGDHNHYTVLHELRVITDRSGEDRPPLILLHDVCWPHARRDTYSAPDRIPAEHRRPLARDALLAPTVPGIATAGIPFSWAAEREGGPRNGVLTAVEDFIAESPGLRFALIPAFFGLGVIWPEKAPWATILSELLAPWDRNSILERLEETRVAYIVDRYRLERQEAVLRSLLNSRAFALAERLSRLRQRGAGVISRDRIRKALGA